MTLGIKKKNFEFSEQFVFCISGLLNRINKNKKKISVLDVGAGSGILKKYLNKNFKYTGTDIYKNKSKNVIFDDIRVLNNSFINKYNNFKELFTLEINREKYLKKDGEKVSIFIFSK